MAFLTLTNVQALAMLFACLQCSFLVTGRVVKRSDDSTLYDLQTLVQQQAAVISSQQALLTSLQNSQTAMQNSQLALQTEISGLKAKVDTLSKAVAFTATFNADSGPDGVPLSAHATLKFDRVVTNAGNGYNPSSGVFTCPVAGYYSLSIVLMVPDSATHPNVELSIVKNGAVVDQAIANNAATQMWEQGSSHTVLYLAAGDQVWIRQEVGDGVRGGWWTVFTGFLVHAA